MKKLFITQLLTLLLIAGFAQTSEPNISFDVIQHDFGEIKEGDGLAKYQFKFSNIGNQPIVISDVKASCGCTTPKWTQEPVLPGANGYIDVAYNPKGRPGPFNKSITVRSNAVNSPVVLRIKGNVQAKPKGVEELYRYKMGDIRMKSNHVNLGNIPNGSSKTKSVEFVNDGSGIVKLGFNSVPGHIAISVTPPSIQPGETGTVNIEFNADKIDDWDFVISRIYVTVNGENVPDNRLSVSATITEDFSNLTEEEMENAAHVSFDSNTFNFGTISQDERVEHEFIMENVGKSDLIIRKIKASCGCTAVTPSKKVIAPGESIAIKTVFNPKGKKGNQRKSISVITNDPLRSKSILWIKGEVNE